MLRDGTCCAGLGETYLEQRDVQAIACRAKRRLEALGLTVTIEGLPTESAA